MAWMICLSSMTTSTAILLFHSSPIVGRASRGPYNGAKLQRGGISITTADTQTSGAPPAGLLAADGISRDFSGVRVLHGIDVTFREGEVHAIIGENGAGKSTLMKILAGYLEPSEGQVLLQGRPVSFASSGDAEDNGVILIHQETSLAPHLSAAANIFLGREYRRGPFLDERRMTAHARELLAQLDTRIDPLARVADLSVSDRQMV